MTAPAEAARLRPIERVILRMRDEGQAIPEIARRLNRKPGTIERILEMIEYRPDAPASDGDDGGPLRPLERVVLRHRERGESYGEIGNRIAKSGATARRIESYARLKLAGSPPPT